MQIYFGQKSLSGQESNLFPSAEDSNPPTHPRKMEWGTVTMVVVAMVMVLRLINQSALFNADQ